MLSDPFAVTYDGNAKSLPRVGASPERTVYRTADSEFEVVVTRTQKVRNGITTLGISLGRRIPDPTPSNVFDNYWVVRNSFGFTYAFDTETRAEASSTIPLLRAALINCVDSTLQSRLLAGEM